MGINDGLPDDPLAKLLKDAKDDREKRQREHEQLRASAPFREQTERLQQLTIDFAHTLRSCWLLATRDHDFVGKSFFLRNLEDLIQSALLSAFAIREGFLNAGRRELRFLLELAVQSLFTDEQMGRDSFDARREFFRYKVRKNSVDDVRDLRLELLDADADPFRKHVVAAWATASAYVHPSPRQLDERVRLAEQGVTIGYESTDQLRETVEEVEKALGIGVVLSFHAIGHSATGDLLVDGFDERDAWSFHRDRFVAAIDAHYDYKAERKAGLDKIRARREARLKT